MSFTNPVTSLPADSITGQIQGTQLAADAIDGKVITGATVRAVRPDGTVAAVMANDPGDGIPGFRAYSDGNATWSELSSGGLNFGAQGLSLYDPMTIYGSASDAAIDIMSGSLGEPYQQARISLRGETATDPPGVFIAGDGNGLSYLDIFAEGILQPTNEARGTVTITGGSGANVSATVGGVFIWGVKFRVFVTVVSGVPSNITGCTVTNLVFNGVNQLSFNIVLCRQGGSTATSVQWHAIGDRQ